MRNPKPILRILRRRLAAGFQHLTPIAGIILGLVAALILGGSTMVKPPLDPHEIEPWVNGASTFLSVLVLHWLLWRYVIPARADLPADLTAFFRPRSTRGFFKGTLGWGYWFIFVYCFLLTGVQGQTMQQGRPGFLAMGLIFITLGTVARLRDAFAYLAREGSSSGHSAAV